MIRKVTKFFKLSLYLSSFIPLWIAITVKNLQSMFNNVALNKAEIISTISLLIISALSLLDIQIEIGTLKSYSFKKTIETVRKDKNSISEILFGFTLMYCLPLVVFNFTTFVGCVQFAIAFFILSFVCLKHNILFPNVVLLLVGFAPYKIKFEHGKTEKTVYSRNRNLATRSDEDIAVYQLNNDVFFNV